MITETITELPIAPSTSDPVNFRSRADSFLASLNTFAPEMNTVISEINSTAQTINDAETSAVQAKDVAVASANFQGTWSSVTAYTVGQSVAYNGNVYRAILASTNQTPTNTTYWVLLTGIKTVNGLSPDASGNVKVEATKGSNIASASTITIGTAGLGDTIHITGTTTITSLGNATAGVMRTLIFDGILTLTHNATSLILPNATNIITAAGDSAEFVCDTTNNWRCLRYTRAITPITPDATSSAKGIDYKALLAEYTVSGSAVTSIDFSGLDINTHKSYRVEIDLAPTSSGALSIFINGDMVATSYNVQFFQGTTTVSASRANNCYVGNLTANEKYQLVANVSLCVNNARILTHGGGGLSSLVQEFCALSKTATVTNITQLTFTASVASSIGVGSKIRIYRGDV